MARPRRDGPRLPCGRLRKQLPASIVEAKEQAVMRQRDAEIDADLHALRKLMSPAAYAGWIEEGCDLDALPLDVRRYLDQTRALRADMGRCQRRQRRLLEMERQLVGSRT